MHEQIHINHWGNMMLNKVAMLQQYTNWTDEYCRKDSIELLVKMQDRVREVGLETLPTEDLKEMGCKWWDEEDSEGNALLLLPLWLLPCVKDGTELTSISGNKAIVGKDEIDNDVRFGCTPYGFIREKR